NARVANATITWGTNDLLTGQVWVNQTDSQGQFWFNPFGDPSGMLPVGRNVVKIESGGRRYMFVLDNHVYPLTCYNPVGGTMPCSEDVFDIGNGSPPVYVTDSTYTTTPANVFVHKPDACRTMCANAPVSSGPTLAACYSNCSVASTGQVPSLDTWLLSY